MVDLFVRPRDDMDGGDGTDATGGSGSRIDRGLDCPYLASDDRGHKPGIDLFIADKLNISCLDHSVCRFDHRNKAHTFNHSECLHNSFPRSFPSPFATENENQNSDRHKERSRKYR
jgi:hypothetical protein